MEILSRTGDRWGGQVCSEMSMSFETKETFEQQDTGAGTNRKRYCGDRCIKDVCKLATAATSRALAFWMSLMIFVDLRICAMYFS